MEISLFDKNFADSFDNLIDENVSWCCLKGRIITFGESDKLCNFFWIDRIEMAKV